VGQENPQSPGPRRAVQELKKLTWPERGSLFQAWVFLSLVSIGLRFGGFPKVKKTLERLAPIPDVAISLDSVSTGRGLAPLIAAAAARNPFNPTCLPRSLTLWWMLRRRRMDCQLRLGVRKADAGVEAHAWVEARGQVLNDSPDVRDRFTAFDPVQWPEGARWH
jgi:hypothetical protein